MKRSFIHLLSAWKNRQDRKPLIIRGARQTGKTFILNEFGRDYFPQYHYFNFEKDGSLAQIFEYDLNPQRIINELNFRLNHAINLDQDLVIFDEIQACPRALSSLKYFNEDLPNLALCSAGSLLGIHLNEASFPVGKVDMLSMHPISFIEFLEANGDERYVKLIQQKPESAIPESIHSYLWNQLKIYFVIGGLPEVVQIYLNKKDHPYEALLAARDKQEQLIIAYHADMAKHSGKVNAMHLDRLWNSIPLQLAQSQDGSVHKFKFKDVVPGISRYDRLVTAIDWLEAAGLIIKIPICKSAQLPFSAYAKENTFKLLCFDVGILGAISGLSPQIILNYDYGSYKGYFAENFVSQELLITRKKLYSWEEGESEIEFLLEHDGVIVPVEVKSGFSTKAKSLQSFKEKYHPPFQIILSAKNYFFDQARRTYFYPLYFSEQLSTLIS
jgi:predicted AAA+ superfamily ATPase